MMSTPPSTTTLQSHSQSHSHSESQPQPQPLGPLLERTQLEAHPEMPHPSSPFTSSETTTTTTTTHTAQAALLRRLYQDLTRLGDVAAPSIVLHRASSDRALPPLRGIEAAQAHEEAMAAAAGGALAMEVESVAANAWFGCVLGVLRAGGRREGEGEGGGRKGGEGGDDGGEDGDGDRGDDDGKDEGRDDEEGTGKRRGRISMPFCGVWRFDEYGRPIEHWENAADPEALARWLRGKE